MNKLEFNGKSSQFSKVEDPDGNFGYQYSESGYIIYGEDHDGNSKIEIHEDLNSGISAMKEAFKIKQAKSKSDLSQQIAEGIRQANKAKDYTLGTVSASIEKSLKDQYLNLK